MKKRWGVVRLLSRQTQRVYQQSWAKRGRTVIVSELVESLQRVKAKKGGKNNKKMQKEHTTPGIRWSSPTQLLVWPSLAYLWESGRDPEFSSGYGRMYCKLAIAVLMYWRRTTRGLGVMQHHFDGYEQIPISNYPKHGAYTLIHTSSRINILHTYIQSFSLRWVEVSLQRGGTNMSEGAIGGWKTSPSVPEQSKQTDRF